MMETDIAWAAGLFEGEGTVFTANQLHRTSGKTYSYPRLELKMTDQDVVERFRSIVGCGSIHFKPKARDHWKDAWCWQLTDAASCRRVVAAFWPYLGTRRKAKATECQLAPVSQ